MGFCFKISLMKLLVFLMSFFCSLFPAHGKVVESAKPQVQISARFVAGDEVLSAPRITSLLGQEATILIGQEAFIDRKGIKSYSGIMFSVTPTISNGKILLEGYAFAGEGKLEGENGIKSQAKNALADLKKRFGDDQRQEKQPAFADQLEMRGMFRMKGKPPRISLKLTNGASFWIELGQTRSGF